MFLKFVDAPSRALIGMSLPMNLIHNRTSDLWRAFMPRRREITGAIGNDLFSVQVYDPMGYRDPFQTSTNFTKWAAAQVEENTVPPTGMATLLLPPGKYAVFLHRGAALTAQDTSRYIAGVWLPASGMVLDARPHFEILGDKYRNNEPASEEEIWIPVCNY